MIRNYFKKNHMIKLKNLTLLTVLLTCSYSMAQDFPLSDPSNQGKWILNGDFSDEFEGAALNKTRWHLQGESCIGTPGCRNGKWFNNFKGRWPAEFTPDNAWVEGGKLILETRWDPDYDFLDECDPNQNNSYCYGKDLNGDPLPITTAAVNTLKEFTYGYMEIYSKAADAEITSSFWTIGGGGEIDMFEMFGKYENAGRKHKEKELKFNMIEWNTGFEPRYDTFIKTDWRVADSFHVYGYEWDNTSITLYIDGVFIQKFTAADFNKGSGTEWFFNTPERLWVDQEVFYWNGLPNQADLPAQFQIEYIRVWQKESQIEDVTPPILSNLDTSMTPTGVVSINVSEQAQLFLVPFGTPSDLNSIKAADVNPTTVTEATATISNRGEFGTYILYAIDWAGNISIASSSFTIAKDETASTEFNNLLKFTMSPNPAKNYVTINSEESSTIKIMNSLGAEIRYIKNASKSQVISTNNLTTGLYFVSVSSYGKNSIKKLIIQ